MQRLLRSGALVTLLLAFLVPSFAGDPPAKTGGGDKKPDTKVGGDTKKKEKFSFGKKYPLPPGDKIPGKITQVDQNTKDFTLHVTGKIQDINQGEYNNYMTAMRQYQQHLQNAANTKNINTRNSELNQAQNALNRAKQHASRAVTLKDGKADYKFRPAENCYYRVLEPPTVYDDKGNEVTLTKEEKERLKYPADLRDKVMVDTKKLSKDELKELTALKGYYPELPGYHADADSLRNNALAFVYTVPPKTKAKDTKDTKKTPEDDLIVLPTDRQEVILIIVDNRKATTPAPAKQ